MEKVTCDGILTEFISKIKNHPSIGKIIEALPEKIKKDLYAHAELLFESAWKGQNNTSCRIPGLFTGFLRGLQSCGHLNIVQRISIDQTVWEICKSTIADLLFKAQEGVPIDKILSLSEEKKK